MRTRRWLARSAVAVAVLAGASVAVGATKLPKPGTGSEVAKLVAASSSIETLPKDLLPPLFQLPGDSAGAYYGVAGRRCDGPTKCLFGDRKSPRIIVLFGDSHAQMWLPALAPVAQSAGYRLALVWMSGCPAASVTVWDDATHANFTWCNTWRASMIEKIHKLDPSLVLLASRTSDVPGANNKPTTDAAWQAGLEETITALKTTSTRVAVIGDITVFSPHNDLPQCLAANPTSVQQCAVSNPNGKTRQHFAAEQAAASAESVPYLNPQPWLCTMTCSPVIGNMAAYYDSFHVSATYAEYLSGVWASALAPLLKH
jgi:SGNH domain-containing protein